MSWKRLHDGLVRLVSLERRIDPFFRPAVDALLREPLGALAQTLLRLIHEAAPDLPVHEQVLPGEEACVRSIIASMSDYSRTLYRPGRYERAGNTKTHGIVRGRFIVESDLPAAFRHGSLRHAVGVSGLGTLCRAGTGPAARYRRCRRIELWHQADGCAGSQAHGRRALYPGFQRHQHAHFTTPNVVENVKLQQWIGRELPLFYFINPRNSHLLDG